MLQMGIQTTAVYKSISTFIIEIMYTVCVV